MSPPWKATPSRRAIVVFGGLATMAAILPWVMPISSAAIRPCTTQFTMSFHSESLSRTPGASGSLEMTSPSTR